MKIIIDEDRTVVLKEVYSGVAMETSEGNRIGICMRDDTLEINVMPNGEHTGNWWRVNMQTGEIEKGKDSTEIEKGKDSTEIVTDADPSNP